MSEFTNEAVADERPYDLSITATTRMMLPSMMPTWMMMPMVGEDGTQVMMPVPVPAPMSVPGAGATYDPKKLYPSMDPSAMGTRRRQDDLYDKAQAKMDGKVEKQTGHYKRRT